jgi:hypothetical protein
MSPDSDLATLRAFLADFEPYLKSDTVFWTVNANLPALTLGGLLLVRRTLGAQRGQLSPTQLAELDSLESQANLLFNRWPANIEKKALQEIKSRLSVWSAALEELGEGYAKTVTPRVHLSLLLPIVARLPEFASYQNRLNLLDTHLRVKLSPSEFIWEAALTETFPRNDFWFLYGRPSTRA